MTTVAGFWTLPARPLSETELELRRLRQAVERSERHCLVERRRLEFVAAWYRRDSAAVGRAFLALCEARDGDVR